jgi:ionotropic kainate glutamate receptor 2
MQMNLKYSYYRSIGGVFVVLLCGLALAILVAILEFCWNSKKNAQTDRQSLCSEMAEELRFAVRCHGSRQRPALKRNCTKCSPGGTTYVPTSYGMTHLGVSSISLNYGFSLAVRHSKEFFFQGMPFQGMPQQGKIFPRNATTRNATPRKFFSKECRFQGTPQQGMPFQGKFFPRNAVSKEFLFLL